MDHHHYGGFEAHEQAVCLGLLADAASFPAQAVGMDWNIES